MAKFRTLMAPSFVENRRDGVIIGEKWILVLEDAEGGSDSATPPNFGEAYDTDHPSCLLASFKINQYKDSQKEVIVCYYTSEVQLVGEYIVPKPKITMGGDVLSLGKGTHTWKSDGATVDQYIQLLIPSATCEAHEYVADMVEAYGLMGGRLGRVSENDPAWLCTSAEPSYASTLKYGEAVYGVAPSEVVLVKYTFSFKNLPVTITESGTTGGWNLLYRGPTTNAWEETTNAIYSDTADGMDFVNLLPF